MVRVTFYEEKKLWKRGIACVAGLDEAGRGPLAGPVVAAAVMVNLKFEIFNLKSNLNLKKINDSKKLTERQREEFYEILTKHPDITFGVGVVSEKVIDKINILEATKLAMQKACSQVLKNTRVDFLLLDGNFKIDTHHLRQGSGEPKQRAIIKGDSKVFSICAAGIIAKVTRDRLMHKMHTKYPQYAFDKHKGYPTALHVKNLKDFGPCEIHRKTFWPVSSLL